MTPMTATPPATDSPIIEPVPNPELELVVDVLVLEAAAPEELAVSDKVCVKVWVQRWSGWRLSWLGSQRRNGRRCRCGGCDADVGW